MLIKLIEKKITITNPKVCMLALTVLDACVKNCPYFRKAFGTSKHLMFLSDFLESLNSGPTKSNPQIAETILTFLHDWAENFGEKYENFVHIYRFFFLIFFN